VFFAARDGGNWYTILYRIQVGQEPEGRVRGIENCVAKLPEQKETYR
jgi:hypothetical protein